MQKIDPIVLLLAGIAVLMVILAMVSAHLFPSDGVTFQLISGIATGAMGSLGLRIKPSGKADADIPPAPGSTVSTEVPPSPQEMK